MPRRVRRPADKAELFQVLADGEDAIFLTYKDLMVCASCIGFSHKVRTPFDKTLEQVPWSTFSGQNDVPIVNAIALAETGQLDILLENDDAHDQKLVIFEEYANTGLELLRTHVLEKPGTALDNMISLIFEHDPGGEQGASDGLGDVLTRLAKQFRDV